MYHQNLTKVSFRKTRVCNLILCFCFLTLGAWAVPSFEVVAPGVEVRQVTLTQPRRLVMTQLRCDPKLVRFSLLLASDRQGKTKVSRAEEMASRFGQLAVINCSYFDEADDVLGYHERLGHVLEPARAQGGVFGGFFYWDGSRAGLKSRDESLPKGVPVLFQAGPRLVWDGSAIAGLETTDRAARSGVAIDRQGRVILFALPVTSQVTLAELPALLSSSVEKGGVGAWRALNFDGGSSTQFVLRGKKRPTTLPGLAPVPAFLGVSPKSGR